LASSSSSHKVPGRARQPRDETFRGIGRRAFPDWPGWALVDEAREIVGASEAALARHFEHDPAMARLVAGHLSVHDGEPTP
jgi:hypothetical protein